MPLYPRLTSLDIPILPRWHGGFLELLAKERADSAAVHHIAQKLQVRIELHVVFLETFANARESLVDGVGEL